jgi:hypothetical protein
MPAYLNNLGCWYHDGHSQTGSIADLEKAILMLQKAVETSADQSIRIIAPNSPAVALGSRFSRSGEGVDLEEAIRIAQKALVGATIYDHSTRPRLSYTVACRLGDRYGRTGALPDLEKSIQAPRELQDLDRVLVRPVSGSHLAQKHTACPVSNLIRCRVRHNHDERAMASLVLTICLEEVKSWFIAEGSGLTLSDRHAKIESDGEVTQREREMCEWCGN